jgi:hypothetical protein
MVSPSADRIPHPFSARLLREGHPTVAMEGNAPERLTASSAGDASSPPAPPGADGGSPPRGRHLRRTQVERFIQAVRDSDRAVVDEMIMRLSRSRPWLAPLALIVGAFAMLFDGVKLLLTNWRLTLIQVLPAMWIWAAMFDLKAHILHGKSFHVLSGPAIVIPIVIAVAAVTTAGFYLNAVFAFAIVQAGRPQIRPAFTQARSHLLVVLGSGGIVGILLGLSTVVVTRWGEFWFAISLSIVVGVMMICYVAVPSRLIGMKTSYGKRDKLAATAVGGAVGAVICTPPYVLGRVGLLMLGSHALYIFIPGVILFAVGLTLQAGATGAVKTVKMSAKLVSGRQVTDGQGPPGDAAHLSQSQD